MTGIWELSYNGIMSGLDNSRSSDFDGAPFRLLLEQLAAGHSPDGTWFQQLSTLIDGVPVPTPQGDRAYGRRLLHESEVGEILLIGWSEGAPCLPHDHGLAFGWVYVVQGAVSSRSWNMDGEPRADDEWKRAEQGAWVFVPQHNVHQMFGVNHAVTLHLYAPQIASMKVYDPAGKKAWVVSGDCGAWIPDESSVVRTLSWGER